MLPLFSQAKRPVGGNSSHELLVFQRRTGLTTLEEQVTPRLRKVERTFLQPGKVAGESQAGQISGTRMMRGGTPRGEVVTGAAQGKCLSHGLLLGTSSRQCGA